MSNGKTIKTYRVIYEFELPGDLKSGQMGFVHTALRIAQKDLTNIVNGVLRAADYKRRLYDREAPKFRVWVKLRMDGERDGDFDNQGELFAAIVKKEEGFK